MKLLVEELKASGVIQEMTPTKNIIVEAIRPHLYRHLFATGSLKVQVLDSMDVLLGESATVDISDIGDLDYFHGYVRFLVNAALQANETYKFKLVGDDGYTFDESAYIGWCNGFDLAKYPNSYSPTTDLSNSLDLEIWERKT